MLTPLIPSKIRDLTLREPTAPGRPRYLSAASGIIEAGGSLYLIADDETHLGIFPASDAVAPGSLYRLFIDELPLEHKPRKDTKPDLEALTWLPSSTGFPHGALLTVPSGSKPQRQRGALLALKTDGTLPPLPLAVDFSRLYAGLSARFEDLNIEGAALHSDRLRLFQRGNAKGGRNAVIELDLPMLLDRLAAGTPPGPDLLRGIREHELGLLQGVPLSFTDACPYLGTGTLFLAAAEATESTFDDGEYRGSVLGLLDEAGAIGWMRPLECRSKPEGLWPVSGTGERLLWIVTDADDVTRPSELLRLELPR